MKINPVIVFALLLTAGCMSYDYKGDSAEPVESVKFIESAPAQGGGRLLGEAVVSGDSRSYNLSDMKQRLQCGAKKAGADAILIVSQQLVPTGEAIREPESYVSLQSNNADLDYSINQLDKDFSFGYGSVGKASSTPGTETYRRIVKAKFYRLDAPVPAAAPAPAPGDAAKPENGAAK